MREKEREGENERKRVTGIIVPYPAWLGQKISSKEGILYLLCIHWNVDKYLRHCLHCPIVVSRSEVDGQCEQKICATHTPQIILSKYNPDPHI